MDIKFTLILVNVILMFVIVAILYYREKKKSKKLQKDFEDLKLSIEKTKEEIDIENKIRQLKDKADSIINDTNDNVKSNINSLSNKKIIEFEEYANQLFEKIELNHKEVVFLYDMLNDKAESVKAMVSQIEAFKKEGFITDGLEKITKDSSIDDRYVVEKEEFKGGLDKLDEIHNSRLDYYDYDDDDEEALIPINEFSSDYQVQNEKIIKLYSLGYSTVEISKKLGLGTGEVALVNNLYKNRVMV